MLSGRPAALLAALSIHLGIKPLLQATSKEILMWRNRWNDLEVPENWNLSCLSLLFNSDKAYRLQHHSIESSEDTSNRSTAPLKFEDRELF